MDNIGQTPQMERPPVTPPAVEPQLLLKWGLALLGEEKAKEYLAWLFSRLPQQTPPKSHLLDT